MRIPLFNFIDNTLDYFEKKQAVYEYTEGRLKELFLNMFSSKDDNMVSFKSRIKNPDSLREKLIRNRFYLDYKTPEQAIDNLSDLIGVTLECRFIRNETEIYKKLFQHFEEVEDEAYYRCKKDSNAFLNLYMPQPQTQRNGFTIYRIDGYYLFNGEKINFELQIKSLVHNFWSDIEHEVVYKNPDFVMYDQFNKEMLGAIRDNLDVVDRQLEIMYNEISRESRHAQIGMDAQGFKKFVAGSINELVNRKMKESVGFTTDFKKCSAVISQYIYIRDFVNGNNNQLRMIDYLELLNVLTESPIDFTAELHLEHDYQSKELFCDALGRYLEKELNVDFQWHVFFMMIFLIQPGNNYEDFNDFLHVIRMLLIQPSWFNGTFTKYSEEDAQATRDYLEESLAEALIDVNKINIVHEDKMFEVMNSFHSVVDITERKYPTYDSFISDRAFVIAQLRKAIDNIFD